MPTNATAPTSVHFVFALENKPAYINMARLLAYSIRHRAGTLADSKITLVFNDHDDAGQTAAFLQNKKLNVNCLTLPRISHKFHYVNKYTVLQAPGLRESADWIVQLDADTAIISQLDELTDILANPNLDFAGIPVLDCPVWGLDKIIRKYTNATPERLEESAHPWFPTKYPLFNGGVTFFRTRHLEMFRTQIPALVETLRNDMRLGGSPNPLRFLRNQWNRFAEKRRPLHPLIIPPYHAKNYADQIALPILIFKHHLKYHTLPHCYNWRSPAANQGPNTPLRILHYLHARFPLDRDHLFNPDSNWLNEYQSSTNPGQRALAELLNEYNHWQKEN